MLGMTDWIILGFWVAFFTGLFWPVLRAAGGDKAMAGELQCADCWDVPETAAGEPGLMPWPPGAPEADPETLLLCGVCWEWQWEQEGQED